jgi:hypothetical protein
VRRGARWDAAARVAVCVGGRLASRCESRSPLPCRSASRCVACRWTPSRVAPAWACRLASRLSRGRRCRVIVSRCASVGRGRAVWRRGFRGSLGWRRAWSRSPVVVSVGIAVCVGVFRGRCVRVAASVGVSGWRRAVNFPRTPLPCRSASRCVSARRWALPCASARFRV